MSKVVQGLPDGVASDHLLIGDDEVHLLHGGDGPPVVYLHAAGGAGAWFPFHQMLSRSLEVYAPEHPGFAGSGEFDWIEDVHDLAFHYIDVLDALSLDRPAIIGSSFGGWIAAELAAYAPERVNRLVLIDPIGLFIDGHSIGDLFAMTPQEKVAALFADPAVAADFFPAEPTVDFLTAIFRDETAFARFAWDPFCHDPKLPRLLPRVTAPTLVLWAEKDRLVDREHAERYAELIPNARLQILPQSGHAAHLERPEDTVAAIEHFMANESEAR